MKSKRDLAGFIQHIHRSLQLNPRPTHHTSPARFLSLSLPPHPKNPDRHRQHIHETPSPAHPTTIAPAVPSLKRPSLVAPLPQHLLRGEKLTDVVHLVGTLASTLGVEGIVEARVVKGRDLGLREDVCNKDG
jgi:hypothetical protein